MEQRKQNELVHSLWMIKTKPMILIIQNVKYLWKVQSQNKKKQQAFKKNNTIINKIKFQ